MASSFTDVTQIGHAATRNPSLRITAPTHVAVGTPIRLTLTLHDAIDIAGYETSLRFDSTAIRYIALEHRKNDLKKLSRDIGPLGVVETPNGVMFGLYSCSFDDCVRRNGAKQAKGGKGKIHLGTVELLPMRPGLVDIALEATIFVDATGARVQVDHATQLLQVRVNGDETGSHIPVSSPASTTTNMPPLARGALGPFDITGDNQVTHADAMEVAIGWMTTREAGSACDVLSDLRLDVNHDGCLDVVDAQLVAAQYSTSMAQEHPRWLSLLVPVARAASLSTPNAQALNLVVTSTADSLDANRGDRICKSAAGQCTLRAAIEEANLHPGPDTINFNIAGTGVRTIQLNSQLPTLSDESGPTTINAYTQPGARTNTQAAASNAVLRVEVVGQGAEKFSAFAISSSGNTIRGLAIYRVRRAFWLTGAGATSNKIFGNFVGTDATGSYGSAGAVDHASGVYMHSGAARNQVGNAVLADRNVISGNAHSGIAAYDEVTDANVMVNNVVGLSPDGTRRLRNLNHGIDINSNASSNIIGGTASGQANVVSGNTHNGIEISHGSGTIGNKIAGNFIGTNAAGTAGHEYTANGQTGVNIEDGVRSNQVYSNVIGNNKLAGISICCRMTPGNQVYSNRIGITRTGQSIPNTVAGVQLHSGVNQARIGPDNIIAYNGVGIRLYSTDTRRNTLTRNAIFANTGLGIDIATLNQPNPNDAGDSDTGPNDKLNTPVLTRAITSEVRGTSCGRCTIEVFQADNGANNYGEGRKFVGQAIASDSGTFVVTISGVSAGAYVTSTATDTMGNTSEFALNHLVGTP